MRAIATWVTVPDRLHQLVEGGRRLPAFGDLAADHERRIGVGRLQVRGDLGGRVLRERLRVGDHQPARLAEQRRRREVLELAALPLAGVDLGGVLTLERRQPGLAQQEGVLAPQERHGNLRRGHRPDATAASRRRTSAGRRLAPVSETAVRRRRPWEGLSHNVHVLSGVSFFQDAASEMLYPVLPLFITGVLGAPPAVVGLIEGLAEGTASILKAVSGRLADRWRRKPLIAAGYSLSSVSKLLIGFAYAWPLVLVARVADRTGKGIRGAPRDALIADDTPQADRGRAFGFHRAADTFGAVVGPLIGLALYYALDQEMRPLFFVAFIPAAISVGLIGVRARAAHGRITSGPRPSRRAPVRSPARTAGSSRSSRSSGS